MHLLGIQTIHVQVVILVHSVKCLFADETGSDRLMVLFFYNQCSAGQQTSQQTQCISTDSGYFGYIIMDIYGGESGLSVYQKTSCSGIPLV